MRLSTCFAPISRLALVAAIGALELTVFAPTARAAEPAATAASGKAPTGAVAPSGKVTAASGTGDAFATPRPTQAPDKKTKDAARKAYSEGEKAYAAGDYPAAYTAYSRANELIPSPHASYWAAKSLDKSGKTEQALQGYEAVLADPGASKIGEEKLSDARARAASLKSGQMAEVTVSSTAPGAVLLVDGVAQPGPLPAVVKLLPGAHKLTITAPGFDAQEVPLEVQAGTKFNQNIELQPHVVAPPPPPPPAPVPEITPAPAAPPPEKHSNVPAYVTLGIAAGGAVVGTIFGVKALQAKNDYDSTPSTQHADDTERNALIADMAFGVAVTLGVTGIVLLTSSDDGTEAAPKAAKLHLPAKPKGTFRVLPYVGRESGGAAARFTF